MKQQQIVKIIALLFVLLMAVIFVAGMVTGQFGKIMGNRTANLTDSQSNSTYTTTEKKKIKRIRIGNQQDEGCIEVSPDGAVRIYDVCGETLTDASRLTETRNVLKLFKLVTENKLDQYTAKPTEGSYIVLVLDTQNGTETYYIPQTGTGGDGIGKDIIDTIQDIEEDMPDPTSTPTSVPSPTDIIFSGSPSPSQVVIPTGSIYPTPTSTPALAPFTCDFTGSSGTKKPYNVSNYICSTEPTPQVR